MKSNSGRNIKSLIIKIIICLFFIAVLLLVESGFGYSKIPFNRIVVNETKNDMNSKMKQVIEMNRKIIEISKKTPVLVKNADKLTNNALVAMNKKEGSIKDIPSILVYLEQTGKNAELIVKKIDIEALDDTAKPKQTAQQKDTGNKLIITATGSYKSFCNYIREIQINTKEKITVEGFKFISIDSTMNVCKVEIEISL